MYFHVSFILTSRDKVVLYKDRYFFIFFVLWCCAMLCMFWKGCVSFAIVLLTFWCVRLSCIWNVLFLLSWIMCVDIRWHSCRSSRCRLYRVFLVFHWSLTSAKKLNTCYNCVNLLNLDCFWNKTCCRYMIMATYI